MADSLSATFAALADPTRRAILARVSTGETSVGELAKPFEMSLPAISKHLKVLERAGLIVRGREAQWRPCRLQADPLKAAAGWIDEYRHHWENNLDALEQYLEKLHGNAVTPHATGVLHGSAATPHATGVLHGNAASPKKRRRKKSATPTP